MQKQKNKKDNRISKSPVKKDVNVKKLNYILLILFGIFIVLFTTFKISGDDDVFWHLETGKFIAENKYIPSTDVFGFLTFGQPWIPFEWSWDLISYLVYNVSGYTGVSILRTLIILAVFYFIYRLVIKLNLNVWISVLISVILMFGMMDRIVPKPQIMSYLFLTVLLYVLISVQNFNRANVKIFYWVPLIFLIWCNMHMGVLAGIVILTIYVISELVIFLKPGYSTFAPLQKPDVIKLAISYVLSLLVLPVNPNGINTYHYVFSHLNMKMLEDVFEWYSPFNKAFAGSMNQYIYILFLLGALFVIYNSYKTKNIFTGLTALVFAIFSLNSGRFTIDFMLVISILVIYNSGKLLISKKLQGSAAPVYAVIVLLIVLIASLPGNSLYSLIKYERTTGTGIDEKYYPVKLVNFIRSNNIQLIGSRPFNSFAMGGYFIWELHGAKNFIDSRNLSDDIYYNYKTVNNKLEGFEKKLEDDNFDYIAWFYPFLTENSIELKTSIVSYLTSKSDKWKLIYWDDQSCLFVRNEDKFKDLTEKYEYKYVNPLYYIHEREPLKKALSENPDAVVKEIQRKYKDDPDGSFINSMVKSFKVPVNR